MNIEKIKLTPIEICGLLQEKRIPVELIPTAFEKLQNEKFYENNEFIIDELFYDGTIGLRSLSRELVVVGEEVVRPIKPAFLVSIFAESLVYSQFNPDTLKTHLNEFFEEEVKFWQSGDMGEEDGLESDIPTNDCYEVYVESIKMTLTFFYGEFKKPRVPEEQFIILETSVEYLP